MNASTKTRALRAVAKVVMSVSWCGGCGGALSATTTPDEGGVDAVTRPADANPMVEYGEDAPADIAIPSTDDATLADAVTVSPADAVAVPVGDASTQPLADALVPDGPLACAIEKDADGGLTASAIQCCLALTASFVPDAAVLPLPIEAGAWKTDASFGACCAALAASGSLIGFVFGGNRDWTMAACEACADTLGQDPTLSCTPWGPPVPPAMPEALEALS
jgi:hypothetical protein